MVMIYIDNGNLYKRVDKWTFNQSVTVPAMYVCGVCYDLFVSINSTLYCSMRDYHQVIAKSLDSVLNTICNCCWYRYRWIHFFNAL